MSINLMAVFEKQKILLDTNIWRYLIDSNASGKLFRSLRNSSNKIQVSPACLYETLRMNDAKLRKKIINLMTNQRFERLMPEAHSECLELIQEIRRLRPNMLKFKPDVAAFMRYEKWWSRKTGGKWVNIRNNTAFEASLLSNLEGSNLNSQRELAKEARQNFRKLGLNQNKIPMDRWMVTVPDNMFEGVKGGDFDAWRTWAVSRWSIAIINLDQTTLEWLSPFLDIDIVLANLGSLQSMLLHEADANLLQKSWLRWAHGMAQSFRKTSSGAVGDNQLFTYLNETDIFISSDKAFLQIIEEIRPFTPENITFPKTVLLPAGVKGIEDLIGKLC